MGLNGLDRRTVYGNHSSAESAGENHENGDVRMRVKKVNLLNSLLYITAIITRRVLFIKLKKRNKVPFGVSVFHIMVTKIFTLWHIFSRVVLSTKILSSTMFKAHGSKVVKYSSTYRNFWAVQMLENVLENESIVSLPKSSTYNHFIILRRILR